MKKRLAVVLAAGMGTRMKSETYKVLHKINGLSMVEHVLRAVNKSAVERVVTIVGHGAETVKEVIGHQSEYALQAEQLGTGHAVLQAKDLILEEKGSTLVICGDTPLLSAETLEELFEVHESTQAKATILTAIAPNPTGYGRIVRYGDGEISQIVEHKDASPEIRSITEINTGTYVFDNQALFTALDQVGNNNVQNEYYLTDVISILAQKDEVVKAHIMDDFDEAIGINDRVALAQASQLMTRRINNNHMRNGVTMINPETIYIEVDVEIGRDTIVEAGVSLKGKTTIGDHVFLGKDTEIVDSEIGNHVVIKNSVIESSNVGGNTTIGPFAHLRPESRISKNVHIGNFVEIKNSSLAEGAKAGHLSYIGDAEIGKNVNVGCGTTFVNYDGKQKNRTTVGDDSFIGSGSLLVAPLEIGERAITAAGSTITQDVQDEALAIARKKQENHQNYWETFNNK